MGECIAYNSGYKYQLKKAYRIDISIIPKSSINTDYITLDKKGKLVIKKGYAWDGPSGPTIDTPSFMRGSLIHDVLYQLMRDGYLDHKQYRQSADVILRDICREDGMCCIRVWWVYFFVHLFGNFAVDPSGRRPITFAPKGCI